MTKNFSRGRGLNAAAHGREAPGLSPGRFTGCGIDAYGQGARMGIRRENTVSYGADQAATVAAFAATAENTRLYASGARANVSYTREQKMRSGDRFDPEARGASGAAPAPVTPVIGGLGWNGQK